MAEIKLENMTERDLLIQQATVLDKLCTTITELKRDNNTEHAAITTKVEKVTDGKVSNRLFFWVSGIMVLCIMGLTAYTGTVKNEVVKNTTCIERIEKNVYVPPGKE